MAALWISEVVISVTVQNKFVLLFKNNCIQTLINGYLSMQELIFKIIFGI